MNKVINQIPSGSKGRWEAQAKHVVSGTPSGKGPGEGRVEGILSRGVLSVTSWLLTSDG